jgi:HK97 family phage major capsid protein
MDLTRLREERLNLVEQAKEIIDTAGEEDRELNQEELNRWDALMADVDRKAEHIQRVVRQSDAEKELAASTGTKAAKRDGGAPLTPAEDRTAASKTEARKAFASWIKNGDATLGDRERRALQMDSDIAGGFLVAPQEFVANLIVFVNDMVWMRQLSTVMSVTNAESLGVPVLDTDPADSDWTQEILTGNADTALVFAKRELRPHPLAKSIRVSNKLLRASVLDVESIVIERLGYKFGVTAEKAYLLGNGAQQPLGVFVASALGISTGRDVSTGNTTTSVTADGLISAKFKLKANYWGNATWIFHRDALAQIRKLKDGNGQYLWSPYGYGLNTTGAPGGPGSQLPGNGASVNSRGVGVILDTPYLLSEYAPNTFTTGLYVGIIGDFHRYWIADSLALQMQRLVELYAATNQVGIIGRLETDGMPVLEEAFVRVALA